jgi:hypothetical protein
VDRPVHPRGADRDRRAKKPPRREPQGLEDYSQARVVIGIHRVDFELFTASKEQRRQAHWRFEFLAWAMKARSTH